MKKIICILCLFFSVNLFASNVYIGGIMTTDGFDKIPAYWYNGQLKKFFVGDNYRNGFDYVCMAVENGKVYVCLTDGENTYIYSNETLLYQINGRSKPNESKMVVLNGNVFLCSGSYLYRNGEKVNLEGESGGDVVVCGGYICYNLGKRVYIDRYGDRVEKSKGYKYTYLEYAGYSLAGNTYKTNLVCRLSGEWAPEVRNHAMKVYASDIYVLGSKEGGGMRLLKNNNDIDEDELYYRGKFSNDKITDYAYVSGRFTFLHNGDYSYIEHPFVTGQKLMQAPVLKRMESIRDSGSSAWYLYVLGKMDYGPVMQPCYWEILVNKDGRTVVQTPTDLPQCVEAYDLIVK